MFCCPQNGATPAVLASKAGHDDVAALIAAASSDARTHAPPMAEPPVHYSYEQLQVDSASRPYVCFCHALRLHFCRYRPFCLSLLMQALRHLGT